MFAGIDFDTNAVHVVLLPELGAPRYLPFALEGHDAFERTRQIRDVMPPRGWWEDEGVIGVGLEEPAGKQTGYQFRVQGAILACLPTSLLVEKFMPSQWRKAVELPGNCPKSVVADFAYEHQREQADEAFNPEWDRVFWEAQWPQDACDAYCLALTVEGLVEPVAA